MAAEDVMPQISFSEVKGLNSATNHFALNNESDDITDADTTTPEMQFYYHKSDNGENVTIINHDGHFNQSDAPFIKVDFSLQFKCSVSPKSSSSSKLGHHEKFSDANGKEVRSNIPCDSPQAHDWTGFQSEYVNIPLAAPKPRRYLPSIRQLLLDIEEDDNRKLSAGGL